MHNPEQLQSTYYLLIPRPGIQPIELISENMRHAKTLNELLGVTSHQVRKNKLFVYVPPEVDWNEYVGDNKIVTHHYYCVKITAGCCPLVNQNIMPESDSEFKTQNVRRIPIRLTKILMYL